MAGIGLLGLPDVQTGPFTGKAAAESRTIKAEIYDILTEDAKIDNTANLGGSTMLNQSATVPYGVFYHHPPAEPTSPLLTFHVGTGVGEHPRITAVYVSVWGNESADTVLVMNRVFVLLERQQLLLAGHRFLQMVWDWQSEEIWHEQIELFSREHRYLLTTWKNSDVLI